MMNRRTLILSLALIAGSSFPCFADQFQGVVESVDSANSSILIKDPVSGAQKSVQVHPKALSDVKKGSVVKATVSAGSNNADTLEVII